MKYDISRMVNDRLREIRSDIETAQYQRNAHYREMLDNLAIEPVVKKQTLFRRIVEWVKKQLDKRYVD